MTAHEFEFARGRSVKFWNIELRGRSCVVRFGRQGTPGQERTKAYPSVARAKRAYVNSVLKKLAEGYVEKVRRSGPGGRPSLKGVPKGGDLLLHAIEVTRSEKQLEFLLANGVDPNLKGPGGVTPLCAAVFHNAPGMVRILLNHGADATGKDWLGRPLLICASEAFPKPKKTVIELLVRHGAVKDLNADLYLDGAKKVCARIQRDPKSVETLDDPVEFLNNAILKKSAELVELLLDRGVNPNAHGRKKPAPLRLAVGTNSARIVRLLLERGADADPTDAHRGSLLGAAQRLHLSTEISAGGRVLKRWENRQRPKIVELLIRYGARPPQPRGQPPATAARAPAGSASPGARAGRGPPGGD